MAEILAAAVACTNAHVIYCYTLTLRIKGCECHRDEVQGEDVTRPNVTTPNAQREKMK